MELIVYLVDCKGVAYPQVSLAVARFAEQACLYWNHPDVLLWAVKTGASVKAEGGGSFRFWADPSFILKLFKQGSHLLSDFRVDKEFNTKRGFCIGRPLASLHTTIPLCIGNACPKILWRVVHNGHPSQGTVARGFGKTKTTALTFQLQLQRHLSWKCRDPSPFMSSTNDYAKVVRMCACYEARGMTGIEILEINTTGEEWNAESRIWEVQELLRRFRLLILQRKMYLMNEFLIENRIPSTRVTRRIDWDGVKGTLDPDGTIRAAARYEIRKSNPKKRKEPDAGEKGEKNKRTRGFKRLKQA